MNALESYRVYGGVLGTHDPVLLSISGGRTSGYMLRHILDAYNGILTPEIHPVFANTGREMPETLDFLVEMARRWNVKITWVERDFDAAEGFRIVSHNSAARNGEPFDALIKRRKFLPNAVSRFCTTELKVYPAAFYMKSLGCKQWASVVGYRADEVRRLLKAEKRDALGKDPWYTLAPLVDADVSKHDVVAWWRAQPFDLRLLSVNGKTLDGNCDGCFLKSASALASFARRHPERMKWWTDWEARMCGFTKRCATGTFRPPVKRSHSEIADMVARQGDLLAPISDDDEGIDCFCGGGE